MLNSFSRRDASQILGITPGRLRYWDRIGLVQPSENLEGKRYYSFQDLICLKTAQGLIHQGLRATRMKKSVDSLKKHFPDTETYWANKRIYVFGSRAVVSHQDHLIDSQSGQLLFQFEVQELARAVAGKIERFGREKTAQDWFEEGLTHDTDENTQLMALEAYNRALAIDPGLADAHVNIGNIHYQRGRFEDAEKSYRLAIDAEPDHAKAYFNLGNSLDEMDRREEALECYEKSLQLEPDFPDTYYNLALTSENLGHREKALRHWQHYLVLEGVGRHADYARRRIKLLQYQLPPL